jgi:FdhD protein
MTPLTPSPCEFGHADTTYRNTDAVRLVGNTAEGVIRRIAEEVPVGLHYNEIPHAVVMATPGNLDDLAIGFSLTDGICLPDDIVGISQHPQDPGITLNVRLSSPALGRFLQTRQQRAARSYTSCGICGIESIDRLPPTRRTGPAMINPTAIRLALAALPEHQVLNRLTGAAHAAAWVSPIGQIVVVREDVGRHNALDKLIGARSRLNEAEQVGFCLVTSRCSYEMVQKATACGAGLLVCISAPTALAVDAAKRSGLSLVALARADSQMVYVGQDHVLGPAG